MSYRACVAKHEVPGTEPKRLVQVWLVDYSRSQLKRDYTFYAAVFEEDHRSKTGWSQVTVEKAADTEAEARTLANEIWSAERDAVRA